MATRSSTLSVRILSLCSIVVSFRSLLMSRSDITTGKRVSRQPKIFCQPDCTHTPEDIWRDMSEPFRQTQAGLADDGFEVAAAYVFIHDLYRAKRQNLWQHEITIRRGWKPAGLRASANRRRG